MLGFCAFCFSNTHFVFMSVQMDLDCDREGQHYRQLLFVVKVGVGNMGKNVMS